MPAELAKTERGFLKVVQYASTISLAAMGGFLYSVKAVNPDVRFEFGLGTLMACIFMGGATWLFWRVLLTKHHLEGTSPRDRRIRILALVGLSAFLVGGMVLASLRAMRPLPQDAYVDMVEGTLMAFAVLAALGVVFWRVVRFLERDHQRVLDEERDGQDQ